MAVRGFDASQKSISTNHRCTPSCQVLRLNFNLATSRGGFQNQNETPANSSNSRNVEPLLRMAQRPPAEPEAQKTDESAEEGHVSPALASQVHTIFHGHTPAGSNRGKRGLSSAPCASSESRLAPIAPRM